MIEDIKKEIIEYRSTILFDGTYSFESGKDFACMKILSILNKYKDQECNYKKAWEKLKTYKIYDDWKITEQDLYAKNIETVKELIDKIEKEIIGE